METLSYPGVQETLYREMLPNGLEVVVLPKPGFRKLMRPFPLDMAPLITILQSAISPNLGAGWNCSFSGA